MTRLQALTQFGALAAGALVLAGCSKEPASQSTTTTTTSTQSASSSTTPPAATATTAATAAPAADNTDTLTGVKLASYTGDASKGEAVFVQCKTCHDPVQNKIGPHLDGVVGRHSGSVEGFNYSTANKNSGITWTPDKLFQYLEKPSRVVPGTKMAFAGISDPQKRADLIAYLETLK